MAKCDILAFVTWNKKEVISPYSDIFFIQNRLDFIFGANPGPAFNWFIRATRQDCPLDNSRTWWFESSGSQSGGLLSPQGTFSKVWRHFWVSQWRGLCKWRLVVEGHQCSWTPTKAQDSHPHRDWAIPKCQHYQEWETLLETVNSALNCPCQS